MRDISSARASGDKRVSHLAPFLPHALVCVCIINRERLRAYTTFCVAEPNVFRKYFPAVKCREARTVTYPTSFRPTPLEVQACPSRHSLSFILRPNLWTWRLVQKHSSGIRVQAHGSSQQLQLLAERLAKNEGQIKDSPGLVKPSCPRSNERYACLSVFRYLTRRCRQRSGSS